MPGSKESNPTELSHPEKIFWPEEGYTKQDLASFYRHIFPKLQPYISDRILTMERCPDGMNGQCFYQKEKPDSFPSNTPTKRIQNSKGSTRKSTNYVLGGAIETQMALVNLGCIPIHVTGSRAKTFPKPDWICFDLDPSSAKFSDAARAALQMQKALDQLGLHSFPKTSGSRGIHIFVPLRVGPTAEQVLKFAEQLVARVAAAYPNELTVEHSIKARGQRVYLDPFRNGSVQTVVTPYSVRRKPHAPISTPLAWSDVKPSLDPTKFNLGNYRAVFKKKDPWSDFFESRQSLTDAIRKLKNL
jgi:bifunctional non-homologous end joining protein LigD